MSRRRRWIVAGLASLVVVAGVGLAIGFIVRDRQRSAPEALNVLNQDFGDIMAEGLKKMASPGLNVDRSVRLEGDVTTLTVTFTNPGPASMKDVVIEGLTLGKEEPRERATLPARFATLAPGASHQLILHFDKLRWIDDGVGVDRDNVTWAKKPFEYKASWTVSGGPGPEKGRPGVEVNFADSHVSNSSMGLLSLDPEEARALKKRRDAGRKGP